MYPNLDTILSCHGILSYFLNIYYEGMGECALAPLPLWTRPIWNKKRFSNEWIRWFSTQGVCKLQAVSEEKIFSKTILPLPPFFIP